MAEEISECSNCSLGFIRVRDEGLVKRKNDLLPADEFRST